MIRGIVFHIPNENLTLYVDARGKVKHENAINYLISGCKLELTMTGKEFFGMNDLFSAGEDVIQLHNCDIAKRILYGISVVLTVFNMGALKRTINRTIASI